METKEFVDRIMADMEAEEYNEFAMSNVLHLLKRRIIEKLKTDAEQHASAAVSMNRAAHEIETLSELY